MCKFKSLCACKVKNLCAIFFMLLGGGLISAQTTLRIAAAADLQPVLPSLIAPFEKANAIHVAVSYASSATLATQIINGAPFDLFLAADTSFPQKVITAGRAVETAPVVYARGTLVLWARKSQDYGPQSQGLLTLKWLTNPLVQHIAVADPEHAPYGRAAIAAFHGLGIFDVVQSKLVYAENIAQAAQYASSGNAQCGLISQTLAASTALRTSGTFIAIPASAYPAVEQGAVIVAGASAGATAQKFLQWMLSPDGQSLLAAGGLQRAQ